MLSNEETSLPSVRLVKKLGRSRMAIGGRPGMATMNPGSAACFVTILLYPCK
jgi:hypothetical protein